MGATAIEWADLTFNPWHGCEKVSPACAHCYAEGQSNRFNGPGMWGAGHGFRFQTDEYWAKPLQWARTWPVKLRRRPRVFCASMADVFEDRFELHAHRARLFNLIEATPELDWLILTKRPEFARQWLSALYRANGKLLTIAAPYPNVWVGVSVENARYTWRVDVLREIQAAVKFISAEPLLGSLFDSEPCTCRSLGVFHAPYCRILSKTRDQRRAPLDLNDIDWVIAGGESGPRARPSHPRWFRDLRDACIWGDLVPCHDEGCCEPPVASDRPAFFFKQWGEWAPRIDEYGRERMAHIGRKTSGRKLDGLTWSEFPEAAGPA